MAEYDKDFEAAFAEDVKPTEAGFGLLPGEEAPADAAAAETAAPAAGEPAAVVMVAEEGGAVDEAVTNAVGADDAAAATAENNEMAATNGEPTPPTSGESQAAAAAEGEMGAEDEPTDPKDIQRKKSWEGRLRAEEARLKKLADELASKGAATGQAPAEAASEAIEQVADKAAATGDGEMAAAADQVAEQVESGEISPEEAMAQLAEDFGPTFVKMIEAIAKKVAGATAGEAAKGVEETISSLRNTAERDHFEAIYDAHPDFMEVAEMPDFKAWVAESGKQDVVDGGSARQINKLLDEFKKTRAVTGDGASDATPAADAAPADPATPGQDALAAAEEAAPAMVDQGAADAAEGVRSAGLRLPESPARADDDFAAAWEKF